MGPSDVCSATGSLEPHPRNIRPAGSSRRTFVDHASPAVTAPAEADVDRPYASSVGWIGAIGAYVALSVPVIASEDEQTVRASYLTMNVVARYAPLPWVYRYAPLPWVGRR